MESNNFDVYLAENKQAACETVLKDIVPNLNARTISWGGSMTFIDTGLYARLKENPDVEVLDTFDKKIPPEEMLERRRQALLVDLFITGTNAVTETGQLVNLDMIGNRIGALTFGPKWVIVLVGRNKIAADLDEAMFRVKNYAAPVNSMRLDKKTPCVKTSFCEECKSPDRICNTWTITEKSFPKGRVKVVLINEDLGL
ncbi:MAG: lactate utilization protein [Desulfobacterales bacterium]